MRRALALALLGLGFATGAAAQAVTARLGGELTGFRYSTVMIPVAVDMSASGGEKLGSYTARLAWNPVALTPCLDQYCGSYNLAGNFPLPQFNVDSVGYGVLKFTAISPAGVGGLVTITQLPFTINDSIGTPLDLSFSEMSAAGTFTNLLPLLTVTSGTICPARGRWGDIDGDGQANSRDALLTLSKVVGLPVDTTYYDTGLADVNADGLVQSVDALIILSHAVGLDIPGQRVLLLAPTSCGTGSARTLSVVPQTAQLVPNQTLPLLLQALDSAGRQVTVSDAVWRSSDSNVATVDGAGVVTPRAAGTATIAGEVGPGVRASATITVIARRPNWFVDARVTGAAVQLGNAAFPMDHPARAFAFVTEGDTIRVASGTYDFTNRSGRGDVAPMQPGAPARSSAFNFDDDMPLAAGVVIVGGTPGDTTTRPVFRAEQYYGVRGLWLTGGTRTVVRNVVFRNLDPAIELDGVRNFALEDSRIEVGQNSYGDGIYSCTSGSMDTVRVDRTVMVGDSSGHAIYFGGCAYTVAAAQLLLIRDSKLLRWGDAVYAYDVDSTVVRNSEISDNDGYGVALYQSYNVYPAIHVARSRLERNYYAAIFGYRTRRVVVDTTVIRAVEDAAIDVSGGCGECGGDTTVQVYLRGDSIYMHAYSYNWLDAYLADTVVIDRTVVRFADTAFAYAYGSVNGRVGRVTNSQFFNAGAGDVFNFYGRDFLADNVQIAGCSSAAAGCDQAYGFDVNSLDARFRNSTFTKLYSAIYATGDGGTHEATNLAMDSVAYAIQLAGDTAFIANNHLTRVAYGGIWHGGGGAGRGVVIQGNGVTCTPFAGSQYGLYLTAARRYTAFADTVTSCDTGLYVSSPLSGSVIRGNAIRNGTYGLRVDQLSFDTVAIAVDSNAMSGTSYAAAYYAGGGHVFFTKNRVESNAVYGLLLTGPTAFMHEVHQNSFAGNAVAAISSTSDSVNAQFNWWNSVAGACQGGDCVLGRVDTTLPLGAPPPGLPGLSPRALFTAAPTPSASTTLAARPAPAPVLPIRPAVRPAPAAKRPRVARPIPADTAPARAAQIQRAETKRAAQEAERASRQERRRRPS